jgi:hypothetical protein
MHERFGVIVLPLLLLVLFSAGCAPFDLTRKPAIAILSPAHGSQFREGASIAIKSEATDPAGIVSVELIIDGLTVRTDSPPGAQSQPSFTLTQTWKAVQGNHTIAVRANNTSNVASDQAVISISVLPPLIALQATATPLAATPTLVPPTDPPPTAVPATVTPTALPPLVTLTACRNNSAFVADVTIPDGTAFAPNQTFDKVWRLTNTGSCPWGAGYQLVHIAGENLSASPVVDAPETAPGATADLRVSMAAPARVGPHTGRWRLRSPSGVFFGVPVFVSIYVSNANPGAPTVQVTPTLDVNEGHPTPTAHSSEASVLNNSPLEHVYIKATKSSNSLGFGP